MGDVNVDLNALTTFAEKMGGLADSGQAHTQGLTVDMVQMHQVLQTNGGFLFNEAEAFVGYHAQVMSSAAAFVNDVLMGAASLSAGAQICAMNYAGTDWINASLIKKITTDVRSHRYGAGAVPLKGSGAVSSDDVNGAFAPTDDSTALFSTDPNGGQGQANVPDMTPEEQKKLQEDFDQKVAAQKAAQAAQLESQRPQWRDGHAAQIGSGDVPLNIPSDETSMPSVPKTTS